MGRRQARDRALELMRLVGIPDARRRAACLSTRAVGRAAPAGDDRDRAVGRPEAAALRRADDGARRHDPGSDPEAARCRCRNELGVSLVFVSHDLAVVAQACRRVAVMYAGQVVETGTVETVFREPRHPYTLGLLRSVPDVDGVRDRLSSIPGAPPDPAAPPPGCPFHPRCPFARRRRARAASFPCARWPEAARPRASATRRAPRRPVTRSGGGAMPETLLEVRGLSMHFVLRGGIGRRLRRAKREVLRAVDGVDLELVRRRDARPRRRVGVRQDDARPLHRRAPRADRRRGPLRGASRGSTPREATGDASRWCSRTPIRRSIRA